MKFSQPSLEVSESGRVPIKLCLAHAMRQGAESVGEKRFARHRKRARAREVDVRERLEAREVGDAVEAIVREVEMFEARQLVDGDFGN